MDHSGNGLNAPGQFELKVGGKAVGAVIDRIQTVAATLEALGYMVYDEEYPEAAEMIRTGREAMTGLVSLVRAGIYGPPTNNGRPEDGQEDENFTNRRRRPIRGRVVGQSGSAGT